MKDYDIWKNTQDTDDQQSPKPYIFIIGLPSGEAVWLDDINDLKELSDQKLIKYYKEYKGIKLNNYCYADVDLNDIKSTTMYLKSKRARTEKHMNIAKEFRAELKKITNNTYIITYSKPSMEFIAIVPDLNLLEDEKLKNIRSLCIRMTNKYFDYEFIYKTRNYRLIGIEYLKETD
jgi:hypothetical protein